MVGPYIIVYHFKMNKDENVHRYEGKKIKMYFQISVQRRHQTSTKTTYAYLIRRRALGSLQKAQVQIYFVSINGSSYNLLCFQKIQKTHLHFKFNTVYMYIVYTCSGQISYNDILFLYSYSPSPVFINVTKSSQLLVIKYINKYKQLVYQKLEHIHKISNIYFCLVCREFLTFHAY